MEIAGLKADEESITFSRNEWKHFLDEVELRGIKKVAQCINNARYLDKLDRSKEQIAKGQVVTKTWEELEAMAI